MKKVTLALLTAGLLAMSATGAQAAGAAESFQTLKGQQKVAHYSDLVNFYFLENTLQLLTRIDVIPQANDHKFHQFEPVRAEEFSLWLRNLTDAELSTLNGQGPNLTRAQAALWLNEAAEQLHLNSTKAFVTYKDTGHLTAKEQQALSTLNQLGVMHGTDHGNFSPDEPLLRWQAAIVLNRLLDQMLQQAETPDYEIVAEQDLPETVYTVAQENKYEAGVYNVNDGAFRYLIIAGGRKGSTGHTLEVSELKETGNGLFFKVTESKPAPNQAVGEAITYPYTVVKLPVSNQKPASLLSVAEAVDGLIVEPMMAEMEYEIVWLDRLDYDGDGLRDEYSVLYGHGRKGGDLYKNGGLLGFYEPSGKLLQKYIPLEPEMATWSSLQVSNLVGDARDEIVMDTDYRGNGGRGAHGISVVRYVEQEEEFYKAPLSLPSWREAFGIEYDAASKTYTIHSPLKDRSWQVELVGEKWKDYDPTEWMTEPYRGSLDPAYEVELTDGVLTTRHWFSTGSHVNGIAIFKGTWELKWGRWVIKNYEFEPLDETTKVTKQ